MISMINIIPSISLDNGLPAAGAPRGVALVNC